MWAGWGSSSRRRGEEGVCGQGGCQAEEEKGRGGSIWAGWVSSRRRRGVRRQLCSAEVRLPAHGHKLVYGTITYTLKTYPSSSGKHYLTNCTAPTAAHTCTAAGRMWPWAGSPQRCSPLESWWTTASPWPARHAQTRPGPGAGTR